MANKNYNFTSKHSTSSYSKEESIKEINYFFNVKYKVRRKIHLHLGYISIVMLWVGAIAFISTFVVGFISIINKTYYNPELNLAPFLNFIYNTFGIGIIGGIIQSIATPLKKYLDETKF